MSVLRATLKGGWLSQARRRNQTGTLIGNITVMNDCWVRPGVTVKRSILLPEPFVRNGAYLEGCVVGHGYNVRMGEQIRARALVCGG